jgi:hypothetical protein
MSPSLRTYTYVYQVLVIENRSPLTSATNADVCFDFEIAKCWEASTREAALAIVLDNCPLRDDQTQKSFSMVAFDSVDGLCGLIWLTRIHSDAMPDFVADTVPR